MKPETRIDENEKTGGFFGGFDLADALILIGFLLFLGGIAHFSRALAAMVAGLLCMVAGWMMERAGAASGKAKL